jgi:DNA-binding Lrp family transcriptional regulator
MCLNKIKVTSVMVGRNPRYEIDIMIIQALQENSQLRYIDIQENINLRCERLGLKKPSTDTITNRLKILRKNDVLHKEEGMYGCTHYSLKYHHHITYVENVLSLRPFRRYVYPIYIKSDDQPVKTTGESLKDKKT